MILDLVDKCWHPDLSVEAVRTVAGDRICCYRYLIPSEDGRFEASSGQHNHANLWKKHLFAIHSYCVQAIKVLLYMKKKFYLNWFQRDMNIYHTNFERQICESFSCYWSSFVGIRFSLSKNVIFPWSLFTHRDQTEEKRQDDSKLKDLEVGATVCSRWNSLDEDERNSMLGR